MEQISFQEVVKLTEGLIQRFEKIEGRPWNAEGVFIELSKQVGELARCMMMYERYYYQGRDVQNPVYAASVDKIGDELSDILWAVMRLARHYQIDLLSAHLTACAEADESLKKKGM